jgi:cell shape-determining protein MreC
MEREEKIIQQQLREIDAEIEIISNRLRLSDSENKRLRKLRRDQKELSEIVQIEERNRQIRRMGRFSNSDWK